MAQGVSFPVIMRGSTAVPGSYAPVLLRLIAPGSVIYTIIVLVLVKILSFYKSYLIFFKRNGLFLQIILYFCALEVVPLSALWGGLVLISHYLKINF